LWSRSSAFGHMPRPPSRRSSESSSLSTCFCVSLPVQLAEIVRRVRAHHGVVRKAHIESVARELIPCAGGKLLAGRGEDAAAIANGKEVLLLAADGIMQELVDKNPYWAGYCSVLVNANDIAAMGGLPLAAVNVLSCEDTRLRARLAKGMKDACDKFGVPMVGGHLHPDTAYSAIDVAMLGRTTPSRLVLSSGARAGDSVVFAMDLDGRFTSGLPFSWDTTSRKLPEEVQSRLAVMRRLAPSLTAGKDISNPGCLGTLGMLLEASSKGATVDLGDIPKPPKADLIQWLLAYQGCGFVVTCQERKAEGVCSAFDSAGLSSASCGRVTARRNLEVRDGDLRKTLFDLRWDRLGCRLSQKI
jgi:putative methanogenesis marker protein 2